MSNEEAFENAPDWAMYRATDKCGVSWFYKFEPRHNDVDIWRADYGQSGFATQLHETIEPCETWKDSLIKRELVLESSHLFDQDFNLEMSGMIKSEPTELTINQDHRRFWNVNGKVVYMPSKSDFINEKPKPKGLDGKNMEQ